MIKIGVLDNFISNFHSNTYYDYFKKEAKECKITHVYAVTDKSPSTNETTAQWCERTGAVMCQSAAEVCKEVDAIMVLAPNNPELHEELCAEAFKWGKRVYVDKTFAPDLETAKRIVQIGQKYNTEFWSSSATRFEPDLKEFLFEGKKAESAVVFGGNVFEVYIIHLVEILSTVMKTGIKSVICKENCGNNVFKIKYKDGRKAFLNHFAGAFAEFTAYPVLEGKSRRVVCGDAFWNEFCAALVRFFESGEKPVEVEDTLYCMALLEALKTAIKNPEREIAVEEI